MCMYMSESVFVCACMRVSVSVCVCGVCRMYVCLCVCSYERKQNNGGLHSVAIFFLV